jgi:hypothetical protein
MKITKRQLKRIIKEEKANLLSESGPVANANRALGLYANISTVDNMTDSLHDLLQEVMMGAEEDGMGVPEAERASRDAAIVAAANAFQGAGILDVYHNLMRMLQR